MAGESAFHDERDAIADHEHQARHGKENQGAGHVDSGPHSKGGDKERDTAGGMQQKSKNKNLVFRPAAQQ